MFMSTLYKKRPEPTSKQKLLFTVDDSLVKLFEYLTLEFSCRKLITPKWKDFRSQKLQFDQKTRLNNAIWRGWHIQYKMKKKARFFQFAAPFSDESVHSTSQAVILDGKYWKRRLDRVTRKFKKWRKFLYKEKLLKNCTTKKEDLEDSDEDIFEIDDKEKKISNDNSKVSDVLDIEDPSTLNGSAMYALSDTLFSSVGTDKLKPFEDSFLSFYKDSSVMIQPTIDHLNPCFDELMENFDFLFSDCSTIPPVDIIHSGDMLSSNVSYDDSSSQSFGNSYFSIHNSKTLETDGRYSLNEHFNNTKNNFPQPLGNKGMLLKNSCTHDSLKGSFQDLPPQLQAPNLTAHLQSVMLSKTPVNLKISSESSVIHSKRTTSQIENVSLPQKKPRRKKSLSESNEPVSIIPSQSSYLQKLSTHIQPKSSFSISDNNLTINSNTGKNQEQSNFICDSSSSFQQSNYSLQPTSSTSQNCNVKTQNQENIITPVINDQQLLTLATLLQCSQPTQSTEATLAYLELLQQQVQLLVKQQQEQLQMKYQIQQHSERVIKQHEYQLQPIEQSVPDCMLQHQSHSTYLQQNPQVLQHRQSVIGSTLGNQTIMNACPLKDLSSEEAIATYKFTKSENKTVSLMENKSSTVKISSQNSLKKSLHCKLDIKPSESTLCNAAVSHNESCTPKYSTVSSPDQHMSDMSKSPFNNVDWNSYEKEQWKPPTTLDSAIALVALRDGAPSMNSYYNLHHTTTVQSSDISSSLRQYNEKLPKIIEEEQKRKLHLTAEQKRRSIIKNAFEDLAALLPTSKDTNQANKLTNASILQKTCDYVNELQRKKKAQEFRINQLKQEIEQYKISIGECQNKIPELSSSELLPQKASDSVEKDFVAFCKELIYANPKSWIFCQIMRPLFNSYNSTVATKTVDQFVSSVMTWFEKYFMLSAIRTIVLNTLTKLSTSTSLLDDPSCLIELVNVAVRENDPTLIPSISTKR
ncbi:MLX-interacting protein isoform X1 [Hydra vulgaris]|uniref:MLX-interacting protein isoform X1 n=1 Tax=Hydra vulgaris TaxID=6087 RepID=UPI000640CB15|nr:MLX-interacting protein [Hydra vulgaris]